MFHFIKDVVCEKSITKQKHSMARKTEVLQVSDYTHGN